MIHYHHVTGMGGVDTARFLQGRHGIMSFIRQDYEGIVFESCSTVILDNGAFSAWKRGIKLDVEGYIRWVEGWSKHPSLDWALIPDVIDGDANDNDVLVNDWPNHLPGVPVWHMHEDISRLEKLCNTFRVVALGSSGAWPNPGTASWWNRISESMGFICDENGRPPCKLHGLRMLDPRIFSQMPLSSADSNNAVRNQGQQNRFGMYVPPTASARASVIADRIESYSSAPVWVRKNQTELFKLAA